MAQETIAESSVGTEAASTLLSIRELSKRFGGTEALKDVHMSLQAGEIHALLGANGAGKSTLIKILAGIYTSDAGKILISGETFIPGSDGIAFVHQDLGLIDDLTIGENMALGYGYPKRRGLIDWKAVDIKAANALEVLGVPLTLDKVVRDLGQAERSLLAIARALVRKAQVLVLDEPTASLPDEDVGRLFEAIFRLKASGVGVIYVSHRLDEVMRIADAVTVLRDGQTVSEYRPLNVPPAKLVEDIVGGTPPKYLKRVMGSDRVAALTVQDLSVEHAGPVSFQVQAGEVLGLAGLRGQGQEEIGRALAGILPVSSGEIRMEDQAQTIKKPADAIAAGIGFSTGKRALEALAPNMNIRENLFLNPLNFGFGSFTLRSIAGEGEAAKAIMERFDIRPRGTERDIAALSGGNQQKVVLARWAGRNYPVLVLEDPTIGVDVGAKAQIYSMLAHDAEAGSAIIVISSDPDEMVEICDRVLTIRGGQITGEIQREDLTVVLLTEAISGVTGTVAA